MLNKDYDPFMHSAEHILNGTMVKMFDIKRSFSQHIEKKKSKCDYYFNRNLSDDELIVLQNKINSVIDENLEVKEEFLTKSEAEIKYNLEKLPEESGEIVRIIKIGEYDACPCIGSHVKFTNEIGKVKVISSSFENGILRIRFKREKID